MAPEAYTYIHCGLNIYGIKALYHFKSGSVMQLVATFTILHSLSPGMRRRDYPRRGMNLRKEICLKSLFGILWFFHVWAWIYFLRTRRYVMDLMMKKIFYACSPIFLASERPRFT